MSDEQLNTAIDEVARRMTEGSPAGAAGFRRRVLARIETGAAPRARWQPLFVVVPLAAAIVIAVVATRSRPGLSGPGVTPQPPVVAVAAPEMAGPKGPALQHAAVNANARPAVRGPRPSGPDRTEPAQQIDADGVAPIAVAPLLVDTLTPESIQIPRLDAVVPIAVAPLDITDAQRREP
jgi:hypothetical protein